MSQYYNAPRKRNLFDPRSDQPFPISRSKIDLFLNCQRCFYLDLRLGIGRPPGYPFALNSAVDKLLKKEFDIYRAKGSIHPLMKKYGIKAKPLAHADLEVWRDSLRRGIQYLHQPTNFLIRGGIDDVWVNDKGELIIVDYKSTAKNQAVSLDADWQIAYKRQMEIYQWLFRQNGFKVSNTGYFVYANGKTDRKAFDARLEFDIAILSYRGKDDWVDKTLKDARRTLESDKLPPPHEDCDFCLYRKAVKGIMDRRKRR